MIIKLRLLPLLISALTLAACAADDNSILPDSSNEDPVGWGCSHDPATFTEPVLQDGTYYENGDTSSPYCFIIKGSDFSVSGDVDKLIDDYDLPYSEELKNADISSPQRDDAQDDLLQKHYPSYDELKQHLCETMVTEIFTVHELDDDCFIYVRNGEEKMLSFEYVSDHEFESGDKRFVLTDK